MSDDDPVERAQRLALIGLSSLRTAIDLAEGLVADRDRFARLVDKGKGASDALLGDLLRLVGWGGSPGRPPAPAPPASGPLAPTRAGRDDARPTPAEVKKPGAVNDRARLAAPARKRPANKTASAKKSVPAKKKKSAPAKRSVPVKKKKTAPARPRS